MCAHERGQPEALLEEAVLAERAGFDAVTCSDVFHPWVDDAGAAGFAWSWLGAAAALTSSIELITTVTSPAARYHPAVVAQAAATMDRLSAGRFTLGVGIGDPINALSLGYATGRYGERANALADAVSVMRRLWDGERVSAELGPLALNEARLYSPPLHPIRLWMAAAGQRSAALAGELADGLITSVKDPSETRDSIVEPFRRAAGAHGRAAPTVMATRWCILADGDDEAWEALRPMRGLRVPGRSKVADPAVLRRRADRMDRAAVLSRYPIAGSAEQLRALYRPLIDDLRADYVSIQIASRDPAAAITLAGEDLLPALRS
jgi:coenzyme F420-dependent glucose-6-phosphate dehydrogenase